jgi:putative glutamine amidotransferase
VPILIGLTYRYPNKAEPYRRALARVGLEAVDLTPDMKRDSVLGLNGLMLSGGTDVNPRRYGFENDPACDDERDEFETRLLKDALKRGVPVLGICRGLQMMNVALGGTLVRDMKHAELHGVKIDSDSQLADAVGMIEYEVNSRHHQAADTPGAGLRVVAKAPDGIIEGLEMPGKRFAMAVQWHPEDRIDSNEGDRRLFEAFARAAGEAGT